MPLLAARSLQDITYMATAAGSRRRSRAETFPTAEEEEDERADGQRANKRRKEERNGAGTTAAASKSKKKTAQQQQPEKRVTRSSIGGGGEVKKQEPVANFKADEDFVFSRKSKRQSLSRTAKSSSSNSTTTTSSKAPAKSKAKVLEPIEEAISSPPPPPPPPRPAAKSRKKKNEAQQVPEEVQDAAVQVVVASKNKKRTAKAETEKAHRERTKRAESVQHLEEQMDNAGLTAVRTPSPTRSKGRRTSSGNVSDASTTVAVLSSETPVIRRNQKFREKAGGGQRRSSIGMRGRRASSLMDNGVIGMDGYGGANEVHEGANGSTAEPHDEISHEDFYKHIEAEMIEPRRLRQLLVWCGKRALAQMPEPKRSKTERVAHQRARIVQEEILKSLIDRQDLTNWFSMVEPEKPPAPKKPNPRNVDNAKRLEDGECDLKRLRQEREAWEALLSKKPPPPPPTESTTTTATGSDATLHTTPTTNGTTTLRPTPLPSTLFPSPMIPTEIPSVILPESQTLPPPPPSQAQLPDPGLVRFNLDSLADSLHKFNEYRLGAEAFAGRVIGEVADRLEEEERLVLSEVGTEMVDAGDVLRVLAGGG